MTQPARVLLVLSACAALAACHADAPDDHAATGDGQNDSEAPCAPVDSVTCPIGYHTLSTEACAPGQARCVADGCGEASTLACVAGWAVTTSSCHAPFARCAPADAGADGG